MLKLKVLLTKMAEMLKTLNDNKVDSHEAQLYINENDTEQSVDGKLYEQIQKTASTGIVSDNYFSIKNLFTRVFKKLSTENVSSGQYPRLGNEYLNTTYQTSEGAKNMYTSQFKFYRQHNFVSCQCEIHSSGSGNTLEKQIFYLFPYRVAPASTVPIPAIYQKADGSVTVWRVDVKPRPNGSSQGWGTIESPLS